ncbi:porin family protein [Aureitalea sp. L0-47]|uniref:porin family protein n=1 Tax=Aureitalea sp. L0-47 TaxID=2816962 RepID=UPI002238D16C|nr:porin family protein [Aureitalea sp. L0-47]MCW5518615.1 porin family protein [Aureitalea sp. L0-47]
MNWRRLKYTFICALVVFAITTSVAQSRFSAEFRPGFNIPTSDLNEENLGLGFGFEVKAAYKMMPHLKAYGGWGWNSFKTDAKDMNDELELTENSFTFGFELQLPVTDPPVTYFLYGGGLLGQLKIEDMSNTINASSDYGLGWQLGGGVEFVLTDYWSLKPDVRYRSLSREFMIMNIPSEVDMNYFAVGLGVMGNF